MASVERSSSPAGSSRCRRSTRPSEPLRAQDGPQPADGREQARLGGDAGVHQVLGAERGRALPADVGEVPVAVAEVGRGGRVLAHQRRRVDPHEPSGPSLERRPPAQLGPHVGVRTGSEGHHPHPVHLGQPRALRATTPAPAARAAIPREPPTTASKDARSVRNGPDGSDHAARCDAWVDRLEARGEGALGVAPPHQRELEPSLGGHVAERGVGHGRGIGGLVGSGPAEHDHVLVAARRRRRPPVRRSPPRPSASVVAEDRSDTGGVAHERRQRVDHLHRRRQQVVARSGAAGAPQPVVGHDLHAGRFRVPRAAG